MASESRIAAEDVWFAYGAQPVVRDVSLAVRRGEMLALAGPNGSGKTTLLRSLSGTLRPDRGRVTLDGADLTTYRPAALARRVAVVAQQVDARLMFRVGELVAMGRTPYLGFLSSLATDDRRAVADALCATDITALAGRRFDELSGGEQQRVMLAMALAQETDFLLLDEPTVHLDLHHQHDLLELLARLHRERELGILAVMHDLNLAALYFQRLAVMSAGELVAEGTPAEVIEDRTALDVFQAPVSVVRHPRTGVPQLLLDRTMPDAPPAGESGATD